MSSGATDQYTLDLNRKAFNSILFRPRVLVDVEIADTRTQMLGQDTSLPVSWALSFQIHKANIVPDLHLSSRYGKTRPP